MAPRFSEGALRRILLPLALAACLYEAGVAWTLWRYIAAPHTEARLPFDMAFRYPRIGRVRAEAADAGVQEGGVLIAVNGQPFTGTKVYARAVHGAGPGNRLRVEWRTGNGGSRQADIVLRPMDSAASILGYPPADFVLQLAVPLFCLLLGFWVAFLRPADRRSWILLGLMISFRGFLELVSRQSHWPAGLQELGLVFKQLIPGTWPVWMMAMGLFFPARLERRWAVSVSLALAVPIAANSIFGTALQWAYYSDGNLLNRLAPYTGLLQRVNLYGTMAGIGLFFAFIALQWQLAGNADVRRRAKLLNIGAHLAFAPSFALVLRSLYLRLDHPFTGVPPVVAIPAVTMMALFPLTLAYIIVVHRAMDVRMVLRTGLQYVLAQRGVAAIQIAIGAALVLYVTRVAESGLPEWVKLPAVATVGWLILVLRSAASRIRDWVDRRYFRESYDAEHILTELSDEVRTMVETGPLVETVARRISASLHVPRVAMFLKDGAGFVSTFSLGLNGQVRFPDSSPLVERFGGSDEPRFFYAEDPACWVDVNNEDRQRLESMQTQLLLPLRAREQLLGFASMGPKLSEEPYSKNDIRLLKSVAAQTGLALENSRLTSQVAQEAARREADQREMKIARDVQQRLFPHRFPNIGGIEYAGACRPAQTVGGDYYDFVEVPGGEFGIAIGDVSGKGVPAALLMASLVAALRGQAMNAPKDLAALMSNVNRLIYDASPKSHFATLFYAQYAPATGLLRYANAGHNPPLLMRASGEVEPLMPSGPGIGMSARSRYHEACLSLSPGDVLIAYTDGFTEAMNAAKDEFGEQRLKEAAATVHALSPDAAIPALMGIVDRFADGAPQADDMTMLVVKVK